jgi:hypothetical protein
MDDKYITDRITNVKNRIIGNCSFTEDRFGNKDRALNIQNKCYVTFRPGKYFSDEFTVMAWIKLNSKPEQWAHIIDFKIEDSFRPINVIFSIANDKLYPSFIIHKKGEWVDITLTNTILEVNKWHHLAVSASEWYSEFYLNGELMKKDDTDKFALNSNIEYQFNYCGKGNNPTDSYLNAVIDDLKIYNRQLEKTEIHFEYNFNMTKSESN